MDMTNIAERLKAKFGMGSRPDLRAQLYDRLECLVENSGSDAPRIYQVIASVAADAIGKQHPDRYFATVVMRRLQEARLVEMAEL